MTKLRRRPAEAAGAAGAAAVLLAVALGVDDAGTVAALGAVVGLLPAAVTTLVDAGGVRGAARRLWRGRGG